MQPVTTNTKRKEKWRRPPEWGPYKFDRTTARRIISAIEIGAYISVAVRAAGIDTHTLRKWIQRGEAAETPELKEFAEQYRVAEHKAEVAALARIMKAAESGIWQASAWLLERRHPDRWARRDRMEIGGNGKPIRINAELTSGDRRREVEVLLATATQRLALPAREPAVTDVEVAEDEEDAT